ncbi:MAG: hypothetical protein ACKOAS_02360 [Verrucomicrobiota bacterium]
MILTIGLTQFVFVSLGLLTVNVLLKAGGFAENVATSFPAFSVWMARDGAWLFALPMLWVAVALLCEQAIRGTLAEKVARMTGVLVAVAIFAAYFYASALLF